MAIDTLNPTLTQGAILAGTELAQAGTVATQTFAGTEVATTLEGFAGAPTTLIETQVASTTPVTEDLFVGTTQYTDGISQLSAMTAPVVAPRRHQLFSPNTLSMNGFPAAIEALVALTKPSPTLAEDKQREANFLAAFKKQFPNMSLESWSVPAKRAQSILAQKMGLTILLAGKISSHAMFNTYNGEAPFQLLEKYKTAVDFLEAVRSTCMSLPTAVPSQSDIQKMIAPWGNRYNAASIYREFNDVDFPVNGDAPPFLRRYSAGQPVFTIAQTENYYESILGAKGAGRAKEAHNCMFVLAMHRISRWNANDVIQAGIEHITYSQEDRLPPAKYLRILDQLGFFGIHITTPEITRLLNDAFPPESEITKPAQYEIIADLYRMMFLALAGIPVKPKLSSKKELEGMLRFLNVADPFYSFEFLDQDLFPYKHYKETVVAALQKAIAESAELEDSTPAVQMAENRPTTTPQAVKTEPVVAPSQTITRASANSPAAVNTRMISKLEIAPWSEKQFAALAEFGIKVDVARDGRQLTLTGGAFDEVKFQDGPATHEIAGYGVADKLEAMLKKNLEGGKPFQIKLESTGERGVKIILMRVADENVAPTAQNTDTETPPSRTPPPAATTQYVRPNGPATTWIPIIRDPEKPAANLLDAAIWSPTDAAKLRASGYDVLIVGSGRTIQITKGRMGNHTTEVEMIFVNPAKKAGRVDAYLRLAEAKGQKNYQIIVKPAKRGDVRISVFVPAASNTWHD